MTDLAESEKVKQDEINQVVAELCLNAPNTQVKQCLQNYQYGKTFKQLKAAFMVNSLKVLTETFISIVPHGTFIPKTKDSLSHNIICKVQNYLSDKCDTCKSVYRFKFGDIPLLECRICGQEAHRPCILRAVGLEEDSSISKEDLLQMMLH